MSLQSQQSSPISWQHLPSELQLMVLEILEALEAHQATRSQQQHRLSPYATISRQWQCFFEGINFKYLILHQSDIPEFDRIVQGQRRRFVKYIWLRLELPEYDCNYCNNPENPKERKKHNITFTNALWDLFASLSTWEKDNSQRGLALELSAHSPSDTKHCFKDLETLINRDPRKKKKENPEKHHDLAHGWENGY